MGSTGRDYRGMFSKLTRRLVPVIASAAALSAAQPAAATDYCVAPDVSCGGTNVGNLESALSAAAVMPDSDRISLGAGTYTAPVAGGYAYNKPTRAVEVIGQ